MMCSLPPPPPLPCIVAHSAGKSADSLDPATLTEEDEDARITSSLLNWIGLGKPSKNYIASWKSPPTILQQGPQYIYIFEAFHSGSERHLFF